MEEPADLYSHNSTEGRAKTRCEPIELCFCYDISYFAKREIFLDSLVMSSSKYNEGIMFMYLSNQEILNGAVYDKENYACRGGCYATRSKAE